MLVRFLSYAASVIGAKRYKPLLISCLAVILSITGIIIVGSAISSGSSDAASRVGQSASADTKHQQSNSPSLNGLEQKSAKDNSSQVATPDEQAAPNAAN